MKYDVWISVPIKIEIEDALSHENAAKQARSIMSQKIDDDAPVGSPTVLATDLIEESEYTDEPPTPASA